MSIREMTMYEIVCDADGCDVATGTYGDWSCWGDPSTAVEDWDNSDNQVAGDKHYCDEHRLPECDGCEEVKGDLVVGIKGGRWCPACLAVTGQEELNL